MDSLPSELFTHILSFTIIRDRFVSRRVCKKWKKTIDANFKSLKKVWFHMLRVTDHDTRQDIINGVIRPPRSCHDREHSVSLLDILFVDDVAWLVEGILDRFITLCPNIKVIVVDGYPDEAFTRSLVYKYRHSLECLVECAASQFYHPCKVPHLKHLITQYIGEYDCMAKANNNYPSLEAITLSDFSGSADDDQFWKSLKNGMKILAYPDNRGEYEYCPDLGHLLASPATETLETVAIGLAPNSHFKIGDENISFPHVKSLQMVIQYDDWDQEDENGDINMPETFPSLPNFRTIFPSVETFTFLPRWTEQRVLNQVLEHLMTRRRKGSRKQLETFRFIATTESKLEMLHKNCDFLPKNVQIVIQYVCSPQVLPILDKVLANVENLTITTHHMNENTRITPLSIINFVKKHMVNGNLQSFIIERHEGSFDFSYKRMCNLRRLYVRNIFLRDIRGKAISLESPTTTPNYLYFSKIKKKK